MKRLTPYIVMLRELIARHRFVAAIGLVVAITAVLTTISMTLYIQSGASGLDLSRPGFVGSRENLQRDATSDFESTGELTAKDIAEFKKLYEKQRTILNSLSGFDDDAMSDESLGFMFIEEPSDQQLESQ